MAYPRNYVKFPENVQHPKKVTIDDNEYSLYGFKFKGLQDFYEFLKKNPKINYEVWRDDNVESIHNDYDFAGEPYDVAIEKLIQDMDPGYQEYLKVQKNIRAKYSSCILLWDE